MVFDSDPAGAEMRSEILNPCAEPDSCPQDSTDPRYANTMDRTNKPGPACITPCTIQLKRNADLMVTFTKAGYRPITVKLGRTVSAAGGAGVAGNVIAGGVTGLVVDSVTGAGMDHTPNPLKVALVPLQAEQPPASRKRR